MTAKTRTGLNIADATGADPESTHGQLMKDHRRPGRPEGASLHSMGESRDDSENADAGTPAGEAATPPQGAGVERPPRVDDEDDGEGEGPDIQESSPEEDPS